MKAALASRIVARRRRGTAARSFGADLAMGGGVSSDFPGEVELGAVPGEGDGEAGIAEKRQHRVILREHVPREVGDALVAGGGDEHPEQRAAAAAGNVRRWLKKRR